MMKINLLLYGAYGYTGKLILEEAIKQGLKPVIAGRNKSKLLPLSEKYKLQYRVLDLEKEQELTESLSDIKVVVHAAGPFIKTAKPMLMACLKTNTHYLDITGEFPVFELCKKLSDEAKRAGIMILPGTGFDVVPSDCLAQYLKKRLPEAVDLKLAFAGMKSGFSKGTAKTTIGNLGEGGIVRKNHKIVRVPNAYKTVTIDFGKFKSQAVTIPWGDISTAHFSTNIPNIEVYMAMKPGIIRGIKWATLLNGLFKLASVKKILINRVEKGKEGPDENERLNGRSYFWGMVTDTNGKSKMARLRTPEGYLLTALTSVHICKKVLEDQFTTGFQTPSTAYGENLILEIEGCKFADV